jgi:hypothetical protein
MRRMLQFCSHMPLHPVFFGFPFEVRLEDLTAAEAAEFVCERCQRRYLIAPYQLLLKFRPLTKMNYIADHFRCHDCPGPGKARWAIYRAEPVLQDVASR